MNEKKLISMFQILKRDVEIYENRRRDKGGQQVPFHNELANASPAVISYLKRLIRFVEEED
jgi:hypothetical protein